MLPPEEEHAERLGKIMAKAFLKELKDDMRFKRTLEDPTSFYWLLFAFIALNLIFNVVGVLWPR